jgi:pyruvate formate lyase activating enzyme
MKKALLFQKLKNQTIRCTACANYCNILEGGTGICGVRNNVDDELFCLDYGKTSGCGIDPIEKKPLFHFYPGAKIFSFGTMGCNFGCLFCQNSWISQQKKGDFSSGTGLRKLAPEQIIKLCLQNQIKMIAYTYNEPSVFFEYTYDTAKLARENGIKNVYVTNGYQSNEARNLVMPYLDAVNVDLKSSRDDFYRKICKASKGVKPVLESIQDYFQNGIWVEVTTLVIPGENDFEEELRQIAEFIASVSKSIPWHISRFHPAYKMMNKNPTPSETLAKAYEIGKNAGLEYVYVGNVNDEKHQSTFCPKCDKLLIERNWGEVRVLHLLVDKCDSCGEKIAGRF